MHGIYYYEKKRKKAITLRLKIIKNLETLIVFNFLFNITKNRITVSHVWFITHSEKNLRYFFNTGNGCEVCGSVLIKKKKKKTVETIIVLQ